MYSSDNVFKNIIIIAIDIGFCIFDIGFNFVYDIGVCVYEITAQKSRQFLYIGFCVFDIGFYVYEIIAQKSRQFLYIGFFDSIDDNGQKY